MNTNILNYFRDYSISDTEDLLKNHLDLSRIAKLIPIYELTNTNFYIESNFGKNIDTVWYKYIISRNLYSSYDDFEEFELL